MESIASLLLFALKLYSIAFTVSVFWYFRLLYLTGGKTKISVDKATVLIVVYITSLYAWVV